MKKNRFLKDKILLRINLKKDFVFLREDFEDLGGYDQVGRALRLLVREKKIIKIGYGLYARAEISPLNGEVIPEKSLPELANEALDRLGVEVKPSELEKKYNQGQITQVPTGRLIAVDGRIIRKIGYGGKYINYERSRA